MFFGFGKHILIINNHISKVRSNFSGVGHLYLELGGYDHKYLNKPTHLETVGPDSNNCRPIGLSPLPR